jgi:hypothetical protein
MILYDPITSESVDGPLALEIRPWPSLDEDKKGKKKVNLSYQEFDKERRAIHNTCCLLQLERLLGNLVCSWRLDVYRSYLDKYTIALITRSIWRWCHTPNNTLHLGDGARQGILVFPTRSILAMVSDTKQRNALHWRWCLTLTTRSIW